MKNYLILFFAISIGCTPIFAQGNKLSENDFTGCWQLTKTEAPANYDLTGYASSDPKTTGRKIEFNSYGKYRIYTTVQSRRCGTPNRMSSGRFSFDEGSQVLKLFGSGNQRTLYWKITRLEKNVYSIDQNFAQKSL